MKSRVQHTNMSGMKRKIDFDSGAKLSKVIDPPRKNKQVLKADLLTELSDFKEKYTALEEKSQKDMKKLENENTKLKDTNKKLSDEVNFLKERVQNVEAQNSLVSKRLISADKFKCYECDFEASSKPLLMCHLFDRHAWKNDQNSEALDLSVGPRFCSKCDYRAEDGYDLDGHFWSEHDDDEIIFFQCKICDESFSFLNDLMMHKKEKHIEKVSFCRNFATNACVYGDESCWFVHEPEEAQENNEFKCDSCEKELNSLSDFLRHRKSNHLESTPICKKFKTGECTFGNEKCWFNHEKEGKDSGQKERNDKNLENNEIIQKMLQKMDTLTKRIIDIENSKV